MTEGQWKDCPGSWSNGESVGGCGGGCGGGGGGIDNVGGAHVARSLAAHDDDDDDDRYDE